MLLLKMEEELLTQMKIGQVEFKKIFKNNNLQLWGKRDLGIVGKIVTVICFVRETTNLYYAVSRPFRKRSYRC